MNEIKRCYDDDVEEDVPAAVKMQSTLGYLNSISKSSPDSELNALVAQLGDD